MKVSEIYQKYSIPINLQEHMLRVAVVARFITNSWIGKDVNPEKILIVSLLHDVGNIVKFDFEKNKSFYTNNEESVEVLIERQKDFIKKYGNDDDEANKNILTELGLQKDLIDIVVSKKFGNSINTSRSNNWALKILLYSDMRVLPQGIGTLEDRFADIMDRMPKYNTRPDIQDLFEACRDIEKQIQERISKPLANAVTLKIDKTLLDLEINL